MRYLIPQLTVEHIGNNWGTCVISPDPKTVNGLAYTRVRKFLVPLESTPVAIFLRDRFQYSSFCPIGVPVRFCPIPRRSIFKHACKNYPTLLGAHELEFLPAITSLLRHLA